MLKLEKASKTIGLRLHFRERDRFFEPQLLKAMGIALILHVGGLLIFHISPFTISSTFVFPPIEVESEYLLEGSTTLLTTSIKEEEDLIPPPLHRLHSMEWSQLSTESELMPEIAFNIHALNSVEERSWPIWQSPMIGGLSEPFVKLALSGELAQQSLIQSDSLLEKRVALGSKPLFPVYVTYSVQLDESNGELFWHERLQSSGKEEVDRLTEKILLNLKFTTLASHEPVAGLLHFAVMIEENKN